MTKSPLTLIGLILVSGLVFNAVESGKVLILPMSFGFNSRLLNVQKIGDMLHDAGHEVHLLMNNKVINHLITKKVKVKSYTVPADIRLVTDLDMIAEGKLTLLNTLAFAGKWFEISRQFCDVQLGNKALLEELRSEKYDLVFVDMLDDCGRILLDYLDAPSIVYQNFGFMPETSVFYPQITSFVCSIGGMACTTDRMSFSERTLNFFYLAFFTYVQYPIVYRTFNGLRDKHNMGTCDVATTYSRSIVLVNSDFVLEYPRPLMPNMFHISGLFHRKPRPLGDGFSEFIESSAPHGVVVLSFGTLVPRFEKHRAEMIARVFGRLKQKVIWRYTGPAPKNLANNTRLTSWFPQNDVLAHPLTKLFITHCGISSVYEAAYNSVPVVAVPLFFDQHYHAGKLIHRAKMGVIIDFETFDEPEFDTAVTEVLGNPSYLENAKRISVLLSDQPIDPKEKLLHLFNYVMRHKGAKHLVSTAAHELNDLQFYSIDVVLFLMTVFGLIFTLICVCCRCLCRSCCSCCRGKKYKQL